MKLFHPLLVVFALLLLLSSEAAAENLPRYRPALLGNHTRSLVNLINTKSLMDRGQRDGTAMFECGVTQLGHGYDSRCYRGSPNTEMLQKEILERIDQTQFEPAVYNYVHVGVYIAGTVMFLIHDGKPQLRIFLHQEESELKAGRDFVAPQFAFVRGNVKFRNFYSPPNAPGHGGVVSLGLDVDATGRVQGVRVEYEHPPGMGFGAAAAGPVRDALFIPGFRDGKPVSCHFTWAMIFTGPGRQMSTG